MTDYNNDEGVSPVVGVILMVAVTVILAAVIGAFVLDLGGNTQENVNAGVSMNETNNGVEVQWIDRGNADQLEVLVNGSKVSGADLTSVGDSVTVTAGADDTVSVRGTSGDTEGVIQNTTAETDTTGGSNPSVVSNNGGGGATSAILVSTLQGFNADTGADRFTLNQVQLEDDDSDDDLSSIEYKILDSNSNIISTKSVLIPGGQYSSSSIIIYPDDSTYSVQNGETYKLEFTVTDSDGNNKTKTRTVTP